MREDRTGHSVSIRDVSWNLDTSKISVGIHSGLLGDFLIPSNYDDLVMEVCYTRGHSERNIIKIETFLHLTPGCLIYLTGFPIKIISFA